MSHLRAPAARADRQEGGRHGRPVARTAPALPETHIRPQLMRLAVLPPVAVALSGTAAVLFTVRSTGARPGITLWAVLAGAVAVTVAGILIAAVAADRAARSVHDRVDALRRSATRGEAELRALVEALRRGETPRQRGQRRRAPEDADDFELLAADLARAYDGAVTAVVQAAQLSSQAGNEQKLEVFVNLARRLQSLVHREISILDELENEIEDPDLLKGLFHVDHLATRIRRHAENLAVLGGAVSRRQWSNPVSMTEVLRSAIAEVEQYSRVKLVPPIDGELRGHAVADVIHLLAELVENATVFSAPHTQVLLRANLVTSGLAVEVEDRGLGMPVGEQSKMNALLADPDQVNVASLLADGRIGLYVVSQLARRHGITVRLQTNIYGGVQAVLVVPQALLGTAPCLPGAAAQPQGPASTGQSPVPPPPHAAAAARGATGDAGPMQAHHGAPENHQVRAEATAGSGTATDGSGTAGTGTVAGQPDTAGRGGAGQAPGTGRRRHAQRGSQGDGTARSEGAQHGSAQGPGAPDPLPVRGAHMQRPNPAEAVPGIRAEDRAAVEANAGTVPTPRGGAVRGTMGKPQLPRRRAQEHIVPQLRGGPAPRQDSETVAGHDPGLMAAFQRGVGLAEAQQHMESDHTDVPHMESGHTTVPHVEFAHVESADVESTYMESAYMESAYMDSAHQASPHRDSGHPESAHRDPAPRDPALTRSLPGEPPRTASGQVGSGHLDPDPFTPVTPAHRDTGSPEATSLHTPSRESAPIRQAHAHAPASDGLHGTGRTDGSTPAR
ncbi:ATP-binding protein [Streptomyces sp. NPDC007971]|uniref:ATP-binding protein n=1 Tax=Streptomyces sp. NPDC007971 TaxID=3364799 RepID=UPI0036E15187